MTDSLPRYILDGREYPKCRYSESSPRNSRTTQDFRLTAIKTYLRLGFEPEITEPDHRARWDELRRITAIEDTL